MDSYLQNLFRAYDSNPQAIDAAGKLIAALRRIHNGEESYKPRNLPCDITTDDKLWAVGGENHEGGGVLEWCYSKEDADEILSKMQLDSRYSNLRAYKWEDDYIPNIRLATSQVTPSWNGPVPWDEMTEEQWNEHYG